MSEEQKQGAGQPGAAGTEGAEPRRIFSMQRVYLRDVSFESPRAPDIFSGDWKPSLNLGINSRSRNIGEDLFEIVLMVTVEAKQDDQVAFLVELQQAGIFVEEANRLREDLPADVQETLLKHETAGTLNDPEYKRASRVFYDRHVCRVTPWPEEVARTFAIIHQDSTVYEGMNGPTEFHVIGSLKDWSIIDRLHNIAAPTLLISGRHDEATPKVVQPFADHIPDVRWTIFEESSHMPHVEERAPCMRVVAAFLDGLEE
jgi:pimeloyl-ACP methyl ester carboxylesterase